MCKIQLLMHQSITVIGAIASGKTTISQILSRELKLPLLDADLFEENPFLPAYIEDNSRWSFATELFFTTRRIKKLAALKSMLSKSSVIVDSGLIMSGLYSKNHLVQGTMTAAEWDFFCDIIKDYKKDIPEPDIVIHLLASPATQLTRIARRGRTFESGYTIEYLSSITDRLTEFVESLAGSPQTKLLQIDTQKFNPESPKDINKIVNKIWNMIG